MAQPKVRFKNFNRTAPLWAGTPQHQPKVLLPGGGHLAASAFTASSNAIGVTVGSNAAQGATSVTVTALTDNNSANAAGSVLIPSGSILDFTGAGKFAILTANAVKGATTLTVEALPEALTAGNVAYYSATPGAKYIQSGTLVGRTWSERDAGTGYGPADVSTPDDEIFLLYFDVDNAVDNNECELYMHGNVVYENLLPGWSSLGSTTKAAIRSRYRCILGQP